MSVGAPDHTRDAEGTYLCPRSVPARVTEVDLMVVHAGPLVTMVGPDGETKGPRRGEALAFIDTITDGAVAIDQGRVVETGTTRDIQASFSARERIDARGRTVLPGFVDTHTHLVWAGSRRWEIDRKVQGHTYQQITAEGGGIPFTVSETRSASVATLTELAVARAHEALAHGTTRLEAKSGYGLAHEAEVAELRAIRDTAGQVPQDITATYLGLHERPPEHRDDVGPYLDAIRTETLPYLKQEGLADTVDAFVETGVYTPDDVRPVLQEAKRLGFPLRLHVDEFSDLGGARFAVEMAARSADHLLSVSDDGIEALAGSDTVATLLPLVPFAVRDPKYAPLRRLHAAGAIVALATDFNPNVPCLSMPTTIQHAVYGMGMRPAEALVAATVNAGYSLDPDAGLGVLAPGHPADLVVTDAQAPDEIAYAFGRDPVRRIVVGGHEVTPKETHPRV